MNTCPRDTTRLLPHPFRDFATARCSLCFGLWLPGPIVNDALGRVALPPGSSATFLQCPDDGGRLFAVRHRDVQIDVCTACGGLWLDQGELEQILRQKGFATRGSGVAIDVASGAIEVAGDVIVTVLQFVVEALADF